MCGSVIKAANPFGSTGNSLIDMGNPLSSRTRTDFNNMTKYVTNKRDVDSPDTSADDAATARLRTETDRIYADLQKKRDMTSADKVAAGEFDAQNALQALASAFTTQSGTDWQPGSLTRARRSTLLAGSSRSQLTRSSSASIAPVTATTTNQFTQSTGATGNVTRLPVNRTNRGNLL